MTDFFSKISNTFSTLNSFKTAQTEHPDAEFSYDEENKVLTWTEKNGESGSIWVNDEITADNNLQPPKTKDISEMTPEEQIQYHMDQGYMTLKKEGWIFREENYIFDANKYEEITGKSINLHELKVMLGIRDGVLRASNDIGFKDHFKTELRDYDTAKLEDVLPSKIIRIPKGCVFDNEYYRNLKKQ